MNVATELSSHRRRVWLWFALVVLLAFGVRAYRVGGRSLWWDEGATVRWARMSPGVMLDQVVGRDMNPPGYFLFMHYWTRAVGGSELAMRMVSVLAGTGAVVFVFLLGRRMFEAEAGTGEGMAAAVAAAAMLAVNDGSIDLARDARGYAAMMFFVAASMYFLYRLLLEGTSVPRIAGYALAAAAAPYAHNFGVFYLCAANLFYVVMWLAWRERLRVPVVKWVGIQLGVALLIVPYVLFIRAALRQVREAFWLARPTPWDFPITIMYFAGGAIATAMLLVLIAFVLARLKKGSDAFSHAFSHAADRTPPTPGQSVSAGPDRRGLAHHDPATINFIFLIIWLLTPVVLPMIYSKIATPIYVHRYAIAAAPALLLGGWGVALALRHGKIGVAIAALTAVVFAHAAYKTLRREWNVNRDQPWREVTAVVDQNARAGDVVVNYGHYPSLGADLYDYYRRNRGPRAMAFSTPLAGSISHAQVDKQMAAIGDVQRVWVITAHEKDPKGLFKAALRSRFTELPSGGDAFRKRGIDLRLYEAGVSVASATTTTATAPTTSASESSTPSP